MSLYRALKVCSYAPHRALIPSFGGSLVLAPDIVGNDAAMEMAAGSCALGSVGVPGDMVGTALFLASRAGSFVTGAIIPVSGGIPGL